MKPISKFISYSHLIVDQFSSQQYSNNLTFQGEKSSDILKDTHEELILQTNSESRFEPNWKLNDRLNESSNSKNEWI